MCDYLLNIINELTLNIYQLLTIYNLCKTNNYYSILLLKSIY